MKQSALKLMLVAAASALANLAHAAAPPTSGITWTKMTQRSSASRIAMCSDGAMYSLDTDKTLWRNTGVIFGGTWTKVDTLPATQDIACADTLVAFNTDKTLWRNTGSPTVPFWTKLGTPTGAKQVSYGFGDPRQATSPLPPAYFALNTDNTIWISPTGKDGTWTVMNKQANAVHIAAGRTGIWMIDTNHDIYRSQVILLQGGGITMNWAFENHAGSADQLSDSPLTSSGAAWALNTDKTIWYGTVNSAPYGIEYHGGLVLPNTQKVHLVWYGAWTSAEKSVVTSLLTHIGGTSYWNIHSTFSDQIGNIGGNQLALGGQFVDNLSQGSTLTSEDNITGIITSAVAAKHLPYSQGNDIYLLLTGRDVSYLGFCASELGHHGIASVPGSATTNVLTPYAVVGNTATKCPAAGWGSIPTPNGTLDSTTSPMLHELDEIITDSNINGGAWYNPCAREDTSYGAANETGDLCAWQPGPTQTNSHGKEWNIGLGVYQYLVQELYVNAPSGGCKLSF